MSSKGGPGIQVSSLLARHFVPLQHFLEVLQVSNVQSERLAALV